MMTDTDELIALAEADAKKHMVEEGIDPQVTQEVDNWKEIYYEDNKEELDQDATRSLDFSESGEAARSRQDHERLYGVYTEDLLRPD